MSEPLKERVEQEDPNQIIDDYQAAIDAVLEARSFEALAHAKAACRRRGQRVVDLLSSLPAEHALVATVWVGLAPATLENLLAKNAEFSRQYEERSKHPDKSFIGRDDMAIEFIGTELGLCLGVKLLTLREGVSQLCSPEIILMCEKVKRQFAYAMDALGVLNTKDLLKVLVKTT